MFLYQNPSGDGVLEAEGAIDRYRRELHEQYVRCAVTRNSAFTKLEAFEGVAGASLDRVVWRAFPKISSATPLPSIDLNRSVQDEYVEWVVVSDKGVRQITFCTEFVEYYTALAAAGMPPLVKGIRESYPDASPTAADCFGDGFVVEGADPDERAGRFRDHSAKNPWNNGEKGILFLSQSSNNLFALFELANDCAVPNSKVPSSEICGSTNCEPGRNSDPAVCQAIQDIAKAGRSLSLTDPAGVTIQQLGGIWSVAGQQIDINDPRVNDGLWKVSRNGHRATLEVREGLTLGGLPISSGSQVAKVLEVSVEVISAPDSALPFWARRGNESTRRIT